jgi:hypothetical protein
MIVQFNFFASSLFRVLSSSLLCAVRSILSGVPPRAWRDVLAAQHGGADAPHTLQ